YHLSRRRCLAARPVRLAYPRRRQEGAVATRGRRRAAFRAARDRGAHPTRARDRQAESDGRGIEPALAPAERRRYSSNAVSADRQRPTNGGKPSGATRPLGHLLLRPSRDVPRRLCSGGRPARRHIGQVVTGIGFEIIVRDGMARLGWTPKRSVAIQHLLGAHITMALDERTPCPATREAVETSMELSMRWAERSRRAFVELPGHGIFGIAQGGVNAELRQRSAARL